MPLHSLGDVDGVLDSWFEPGLVLIAAIIQEVNW